MEKEYLFRIFSDSLKKIGEIDLSLLFFDRPKQDDHGDLSTNIAMQLAKSLKKSPREIAQLILDNLEYDTNVIEKIEIAGAGFINIKFQLVFWTILFEKLRLLGPDIGRSNSGKGIKVNVEYVSANPTGLLHLGHGRNAVTGDTIANLYEWGGYDVTREYYFNNAGNQMNNLMLSIYSRYRQIEDENYVLPENAYHGEYIKTIAQELKNIYGDSLIDLTDSNKEIIRKFGENWCFKKIETTLSNLKIKQDVFYNEDSLYKDGKIDLLLNEFKEKELSYEKDGAIWFKFSELGLEKDRVIVKSSGEPTYRLPDIAYHKEKFERGFDLIIDVFGADHIAAIPDVIGAVEALGYDKSKIHILIHQFVTLTENGEQVKMSKRTGKSYTLDDLLDEVGGDVVRFFLLSRGINTHLEFDLSIAKEQNDKNPVFYLQYAHARICSLIENCKNTGIEVLNYYNYKLLVHQSEIQLIKELLAFENVIFNSREKHEPHLLTEYMKTLASSFHKFFHDCRIIGEDIELAKARINLAYQTKIILKNGFDILGIKAPEKM